MDMDWLQHRVRYGPSVDWSQYGDVRAVYEGDLVLFNYTAKAQYARRWNWFERISRGLILNWKTGEIVARPFDKFFNWGEGDRTTNASIVAVTEKIDGSLGILYRDETMPRICRHKIATRGSFDSDQALWATDHLSRLYDLCDLPNEYTLLFEIVYPDNRIVVDYGSMEDLFLVAVRNRFSGTYLSWHLMFDLADHYGFLLPQKYNVNSVIELLRMAETLDSSHEGWVAEFSDGQRFKFKGEQYKELHRIVTNASFKRVLEAVRDGTYTDMVSSIPDEFLSQIKEWRAQIHRTVREVKAIVNDVYERAPKSSRKEFAQWVKTFRPDLAPYLFMKLDGKPLEPVIYKREF